MDKETHNSYDSLAQMMDQWRMRDILNIFAEKLLLNFVYCNKDDQKSERIISASLEVLSFYTSSQSSCRLIGKTDIMQKLI